MPVKELLEANPELIAKVKLLAGRIAWQRASSDGWYYSELLTQPINGDKPRLRCEMYWQERGAALWGESFNSAAEAIAWAYAEGRL